MPLQEPFPATPWQASLLPASFRGVPFGVTEGRGAAGRRGRLHEYPSRDTPYAEDLGRRARRYAISAFVLGDDAAAQRDALMTACEQAGPGILIHPSLGILNVQVDPETPIEWSLRLEEGRSIEIRLAFVEPGQVSYPETAGDTRAATNAAADKVGAGADADIADKTADIGQTGDTAIPAGSSIPQQAAQVEASERTPPPGAADDAAIAGSGPTRLDVHDDLDGAPSPAQQSAAGGPAMAPTAPDSASALDTETRALMVVPF